MPTEVLRRPPVKREAAAGIPDFSRVNIERGAGTQKQYFTVEHRPLGPGRISVRVQETYETGQPKPGGVVGGVLKFAAMARATERMDVLMDDAERREDADAMRRITRIRNGLLIELAKSREQHGPIVDEAVRRFLTRDQSRERILRFFKEKETRVREIA